MSSYNPMFVGNAVLAAGVSEFAAGLPDQYERVERGLRLIEHRLPGGEPYTCLQAGRRELELFHEGPRRPDGFCARLGTARRLSTC